MNALSKSFILYTIYALFVQTIKIILGHLNPQHTLTYNTTQQGRVISQLNILNYFD